MERRALVVVMTVVAVLAKVPAFAAQPGSVPAAGETDPVRHEGDAADDVAIWVDPSDPGRSTIIGTDKEGGLAVYDLSGRQLHYYDDGPQNNVDLRDGFPLGDRPVALVASSDTAADGIRLYAVDPASRGLVEVTEGPISVGIGAAGLCLYRSPTSGTYYVFVGDSSGTVQQWELVTDGAGGVEATKARTISLGSTTEGCVADDDTGALYIAEEDVALWRYGAEPDAGEARTAVDTVGEGRLAADVEGLAIYDDGGGAGYLIASSQGSDSFAVYERGEGNRYVAAFSIGGGAVDGVTHTDGIAATSAALSVAFPDGLFVAQDDDNDGGNQNFKLVPWGDIARAANPPLAADDRAWSAVRASASPGRR